MYSSLYHIGWFKLQKKRKEKHKDNIVLTMRRVLLGPGGKGVVKITFHGTYKLVLSQFTRTKIGILRFFNFNLKKVSFFDTNLCKLWYFFEDSYVNHLSVKLISSIKIIIIIIIIIIIRIQNGGRIAENATHINENSSTKLEFSYNLLIPLE